MVGNSCGVGALKGWDGTKATHIEPIAFRTESILAYGPIRTIVDVTVKGWNYQGKELNMTNRYILYAGHRDLLVETSLTNRWRTKCSVPVCRISWATKHARNQITKD